jgi:integrase
MNTEPKTLRDIILRFKLSPEGRAITPGTRRARERMLYRAVRRWGSLSLTEIEHRSFRSKLYDWRDEYADRPSEARNNIGTLCTVLNFAVDRGWIRDNPAAGMKALKTVRRHADDIWTQEGLTALLAASSPQLQDVIAVAVYTGLRESDVIRVAAIDCPEGWISVIPKKTKHSSGVRVELPYPLIPPLAEIFDRLLAQPHLDWTRNVGEPLLRQWTGARWSERQVRKEFTKAKARAGLSDTGLRFHDLRGTLTTWLLEAGCTDAEVGAITGGALAKGNTRAYAARTRELATNAYTKLAAKIGAER